MKKNLWNLSLIDRLYTVKDDQNGEPGLISKPIYSISRIESDDKTVRIELDDKRTTVMGHGASTICADMRGKQFFIDPDEASRIMVEELKRKAEELINRAEVLHKKLNEGFDDKER